MPQDVAGGVVLPGERTLAFSGAASGLISSDVNRASRPPLRCLVMRLRLTVTLFYQDRFAQNLIPIYLSFCLIKSNRFQEAGTCYFVSENGCQYLMYTVRFE